MNSIIYFYAAQMNKYVFHIVFAINDYSLKQMKYKCL